MTQDESITIPSKRMLAWLYNAYTGKRSAAVISRLREFCDWATAGGEMPLVPNLPGWYQTLLQDRHKSASAIKHYQATVRSAYSMLLQTNIVAKYLDRLFLDVGLSPQQRRHRIQQTMEQLADALDPRLTPTTTVIRSHLANRAPILSPDQVRELLLAPDVSTLRGRRDAAVLALLACTGIHSRQLVNLDVSDLYQRIDEITPALRIRFPEKQRLIPFGELIKARELAHIWHTSAGLSTGPLFVQLERGNHLPSEYAQPVRLTHNSVVRILRAYPVTNRDGSRLLVSCLDLRHTYIQSLRQIGIEAISLYKEVDYSYTAPDLPYEEISDRKRMPPDIYGLSKLGEVIA